MEAIHFGPMTRPLFGLHHRAQGAPRRTAVLLCPAWGPEYLRAYRGLQVLAKALSARGFECLRFDYSGTGDSEGAALDARLPNWIQDIKSAAQELLDLSGAERLAIIGHRSGALVAAEARRQGVAFDTLLALDAPLDGASHVATLQRIGIAEDARRNRYRSLGNELPPAQADELCGHAWPADLARAFTGLPRLTPDRMRWLNSRDHRIPSPEGALTYTLQDDGHWQHPQWIYSPWCPTPALNRLAEDCAAWLA